MQRNVDLARELPRKGGAPPLLLTACHLDWAVLPAWLDGTFDLVVASEALYAPSVAPHFFATTAAALRDGGRLVLAFNPRPAVDLHRDVLPAARACHLALVTPEVESELQPMKEGTALILTFARQRVQTTKPTTHAGTVVHRELSAERRASWVLSCAEK